MNLLVWRVVVGCILPVVVRDVLWSLEEQGMALLVGEKDGRDLFWPM